MNDYNCCVNLNTCECDPLCWDVLYPEHLEEELKDINGYIQWLDSEISKIKTCKELEMDESIKTELQKIQCKYNLAIIEKYEIINTISSCEKKRNDFK